MTISHLLLYCLACTGTRNNWYHIDFKCLILCCVFNSILYADTIEEDIQQNTQHASENSYVKLELAVLD